jgi:hypothetical protein
MTTDDTRHPTDAEMDALEAIFHPEGRCAVCGGGKPYWKHTANETEYHPFIPPTADDTRPLSAEHYVGDGCDEHVLVRRVPSVRESSARLGITMTEHNAPDIVRPAPFDDDSEDFTVRRVTTPDGQVYEAATPAPALMVNFGPDATPEQVDVAVEQIRALAPALDMEAIRDAFLAGVRRGASDGMEGYPMVADDYLAALRAALIEEARNG